MINYDILLKKKGDTMPKIKIKYTVISKTLNEDENYSESKIVDAILENNKVKYMENNTTVIFNYIDKTLRRSNDQLDMIHDFNNKTSNVHILSLGRYIRENIELIDYQSNDNNISINYKVNDIKINYKVEVQ